MSGRWAKFRGDFAGFRARKGAFQQHLRRCKSESYSSEWISVSRASGQHEKPSLERWDRTLSLFKFLGVDAAFLGGMNPRYVLVGLIYHVQLDVLLIMRLVTRYFASLLSIWHVLGHAYCSETSRFQLFNHDDLHIFISCATLNLKNSVQDVTFFLVLEWIRA